MRSRVLLIPSWRFYWWALILRHPVHYHVRSPVTAPKKLHLSSQRGSRRRLDFVRNPGFTLWSVSLHARGSAGTENGPVVQRKNVIERSCVKCFSESLGLEGFRDAMYKKDFKIDDAQKNHWCAKSSYVAICSRKYHGISVIFFFNLRKKLKLFEEKKFYHAIQKYAPIIVEIMVLRSYLIFLALLFL